MPAVGCFVTLLLLLTSPGVLDLAPTSDAAIPRSCQEAIANAFDVGDDLACVHDLTGLPRRFA